MLQKKIFGALMILCCFFGTASAQQEIRIGGNLLYSGTLNTAGLGAFGELQIQEQMFLSAGLGFYVPRNEFFVRTSAIEFNANFNYLFAEADNFSFYGLGGLNFTNITSRVDFGLQGISSSERSNVGRLGLNLGAGANFDLGTNIIPFAEARYIIGNFDRFVVGAGVKFKL